MRTRFFSVGALTAFVGAAVAAQGPASDDVLWKIRREATERSKILETLSVLTDLYGPRLTGSPNAKGAAEWAVKRLGDWGLVNGHLEPWDFGHPGWLNERFSAHLVSPVNDALVGEVLAWTPGTTGAVRAPVYQLVPPERPTKDEMTAFLAGVGDAVKGRIVLVGRHQPVPVTMNPSAKRIEEQQARAQYDPVNPAPPAFMAAMLAAQARQQPPQAGPPRLTAQQANDDIDAFLIARGASVRVNDGGRDHGQIRAFNNRSYDETKAPPTVILRSEDYGRIERLLKAGHVVELEVAIKNRTFPEGKTAYNAVAEIPGTDRTREVVMLGAHLDSWHAATGATDNGIGSATMMEVARILKAIGVKPRRTIRVALWSGEEQGLLGSKAYVKEHFGTFEQPTPDYATLVAYFNIDSGTGRARGMSVFGPAEAATVVRKAIAPFTDLGVAGATSSRSRAFGGSDHTAFNNAGLPGISVGQDPIEYGSATWHTNLDTYERIIEADAIASATVIAAAVYQLAMADEMLPRFTKEQMPEPVKEGPPGSPAAPPAAATPATAGQ